MSKRMGVGVVLYIGSVCASLNSVNVSYGAGASSAYRIQRDMLSPAGGSSASAGYKVSAALGALSGTITAKSSNYSVVAGALLSHVGSPLLEVLLSGSGSGSVNSNPGGIACTGGVCSASFPQGTLVTLMQLPASDSVFRGWSGDCINASGDCVIVMNSRKAVTAMFAASPPVRLLGASTTGYSLLQSAYDDAQNGNAIQGRAVVLSGDLVADKAKTISINGGYDAGYVSRSGVFVVDGKILIRSGKVTAWDVKIK